MLQLGWVSWGNQLHVWCCEPGARCSPRHGLLGSPVGCRAMKLPSIPRTVTEHGDLWDEAQRDAEGACKMGMGGSGGWGGAPGVCWVMDTEQEEHGHHRSSRARSRARRKCRLGKPRSVLESRCCTEEPSDGTCSYNMRHLPSRVCAAPFRSSWVLSYGISHPGTTSPILGLCSIPYVGTWHHLPSRDRVASPTSCRISHFRSTQHFPSQDHTASPTLAPHGTSNLGTCHLSHLGATQHFPRGISHLIQHSPILGSYGTPPSQDTVPPPPRDPACSILPPWEQWQLPPSLLAAVLSSGESRGEHGRLCAVRGGHGAAAPQGVGSGDPRAQRGVGGFVPGFGRVLLLGVEMLVFSLCIRAVLKLEKRGLEVSLPLGPRPKAHGEVMEPLK